jgi:hypothetical protein
MHADDDIQYRGHVSGRGVVGRGPSGHCGNSGGGQWHGDRPSRGRRPGEALIVGGFAPRDGRHGPYAHRASRRRGAVRVAAPLAVPVALGVTLGVILAVSSGPSNAHVTQQGSTTSSSTSAPAPSPSPSR